MLVFNVNDFDEAYVGPYIWDLKRFAASVALLGLRQGAVGRGDRRARRRLRRRLPAELAAIARGGDDAIGSLTLDTTTGVLHRVLQTARLSTRVAMLEVETVVEEYDRRFAFMDGREPVEAATRRRCWRRSRTT